jgi:NAD+--dinitrogen-reductase ADP-D-ribosyltransferase
LLYTYCQYELKREYPEQTHLTLYRGINRMDEHEVQSTCESDLQCVLLNNLNSFTSARERADEFGDYILETQIPLPKILFFNRLLPGMLKGEDEYVVIGGVYEVSINTI